MLKYLKSYESNNFKVGEYAVCINEPHYYGKNIAFKIKKGEKYKIVDQDDTSLFIANRKDGKYEQYFKLHFATELEVIANKYNL